MPQRDTAWCPSFHHVAGFEDYELTQISDDLTDAENHELVIGYTEPPACLRSHTNAS